MIDSKTPIYGMIAFLEVSRFVNVLESGLRPEQSSGYTQLVMPPVFYP